jgi:hypothetical protein
VSEIPDNDSARGPQKRLQPFLDCISYLLARRWLREQRQREDEPQERHEPHDEQSEAD